MAVSPAPAPPRIHSPARRFGYSIAIVVNVLMTYVVSNLQEWETLPFLTADFDRLLPVIVVAFFAAVIVNVFYLWDDAPYIKASGQILTGVISFVVAVKTWTIFPFDFSPYDFNWEAVARGILIISMVGVTLGLMVETVRLVRTARLAR